VVIAVVLGVLALGVVVVDPLREAVQYAVRGDVDALRDELRRLGVGGAAILVALILVHAVVFFPAEIANAAAGLIYGFAAGFALVIVAWIGSLLLAYGLGATAGRPLALRLAGRRRVELAERVIDRGGVPMLLLARLVPFLPLSLVGYVAAPPACPSGATRGRAHWASRRSPRPPRTWAMRWTTSRSPTLSSGLPRPCSWRSSARRCSCSAGRGPRTDRARWPPGVGSRVR